MDQSVTLSEREWQQVVNAIANQPWHLANPLLMRIGEQLRNQPPREGTPQFGVAQHTNSGEQKPS